MNDRSATKTKQIMQTQTKQIMKKVRPCFIIDAPYEFMVEHDVVRLKEWLNEQESHPGMKTVVTSRPEKRILDIIEHSQSSQLNLSP